MIIAAAVHKAQGCTGNKPIITPLVCFRPAWYGPSSSGPHEQGQTIEKPLAPPGADPPLLDRGTRCFRAFERTRVRQLYFGCIEMLE